MCIRSRAHSIDDLDGRRIENCDCFGARVHLSDVPNAGQPLSKIRYAATTVLHVLLLRLWILDLSGRDDRDMIGYVLASYLRKFKTADNHAIHTERRWLRFLKWSTVLRRPVIADVRRQSTSDFTKHPLSKESSNEFRIFAR